MFVLIAKTKRLSNDVADSRKRTARLECKRLMTGDGTVEFRRNGRYGCDRNLKKYFGLFYLLKKQLPA